MKPAIKVMIWMLTALALSGWGSPLSRETNYLVNWELAYAEVAAAPEAHRGKTLLLGGQIVDHQVTAKGSLMTLLCYRLDRDDRPVEPDPACGRFRLAGPRVFDSEHFRPGRLLTLTATVQGSSEEGLPLFRPREVHLWPDPHARPTYYYDPWCDPFDPFYPHGYYRRCW